MRVLIGVATFPATDETPHEVYPATKAAIDALEFDGEIAIDFFGGDDPALDPRDNLTHKHNQMRQRVLDDGYDALLTIEADMIVPPDALAKLASVEADVVYGVYCSRAHPMVLTFPTIDGYRGRSISADTQEYRGKFGGIIPCEGVGFGCTLIRRHVLEAVEFRRDVSTAMRRKFADDWTFALDVKAAGFESAAHLGVLCGHIQRDGVVRWVDADAPTFMRLEGEARAARGTLPPVARYHVLKLLSSPSRDYRPGSEIELSAEAATILLGLGKIQIIQEI